MRAHQHAAPLVVVRSEAEAGRVGMRLIGELDLNTVVLLEAELAGSREHAPPAVIDLSELRFLDLVGLRALLRLGQAEGVPDTRLVGATGIVRRLIELTRVLDAEQAAAGEPFPGEPTTTVTSEVFSPRFACRERDHSEWQRQQPEGRPQQRQWQWPRSCQRRWGRSMRRRSARLSSAIEFNVPAVLGMAPATSHVPPRLPSLARSASAMPA